MKKVLKILLIILGVLVAAALVFILVLTVTEYRPADTEPVTPGQAGTLETRTAAPGDTLSILSWNTGYCALDENASFVMDGGTGDGSAADEATAQANFDAILETLTAQAPDIVFLQEVDRDSARSFRLDEAVGYLDGLAGTLGGLSAAYALNYKCLFVPFPFPPMGQVESGIETLSAFSITEAERVALPCPFSWPLRTANLKRCLLVSRIPLEGTDAQLVLVNLHLEAYDSGEGKAAQTRELTEFIEAEYEKGNYVIAGGDFNQTFPGALDTCPLTGADDLWTPGVLEADSLPEGFSFAFDASTPTCRSLDRPYDPDDPDFRLYVIDGFILSPNVELRSVQTLDEGFANTDHNPVSLSVRLSDAQ